MADIEAAAEKRDVLRFLEADRRFHLDLLAHCGNKRLINAVANLRDQTRLYGLEVLAQSGTIADSAREHRDLLEAIAHGDTARVESLVQAHLHHVRSDWEDSEEP